MTNENFQKLALEKPDSLEQGQNRLEQNHICNISELYNYLNQ